MSNAELGDRDLESVTFRDAELGLTSEFNYTLDSVDFTSHVPLDIGRHHAIEGRGLGSLDRLSHDLLVTILLSTDIPSLTVFRAVNQHAMAVVDSLYEYRMLIKNCPKILRAVIALEAHAYSLRTLFNELCKTKCRWCRCEFASCLYLITCERTCQSCACYLTNTPASPEEASFITKVPENEVWRRYPSILSVPGEYGFAMLDGQVETTERLRLIDNLAIRGRHSSDTALGGPNSMHSVMSHVHDRRDTRFMVLITAPYFLALGNGGYVADWGYYCAGCRCQRTNASQKFTKQQFIDHLVTAGPVFWENDKVQYWKTDTVPEDLKAQGYQAKHTVQAQPESQPESQPV